MFLKTTHIMLNFYVMSVLLNGNEYLTIFSQNKKYHEASEIYISREVFSEYKGLTLHIGLNLAR